MRAELGDDDDRGWLEGMAANDSPVLRQQRRDRRGRRPGRDPDGPGQPLLQRRALAEDPDLPSRNHFFPDDDLGSLLLVAAATVLEGADVPDEADELVEFLLTDESQTYFAEETFEYPLVDGRRAGRATCRRSRA